MLPTTIKKKKRHTFFIILFEGMNYLCRKGLRYKIKIPMAPFLILSLVLSVCVSKRQKKKQKRNLRNLFIFDVVPPKKEEINFE